MFDLIDEMSELIYVVDIDTYDLLFVNRSGKETFGLDELAGLKCYRALQGRDHPCEFCTNNILKENQFYSWEWTNPVVKRHYLLKDKLIDWDGKKARVEIAFDTTDSEVEKNNLRYSLEAENLVTECAQKLFVSGQEDNKIDTVLQMIGTFLEADRAYIFEIYKDNTMSNTYEWCKAGIEPQISSLRSLPLPLIDRWMSCFHHHRCVSIESVEAICYESPSEYEELSRQGIHSLIAAPIFTNQVLTGYIGVDNYEIKKLANASVILSSIAYFVGAMFQNMKSLQLLEKLSFFDVLTELGNRNKFNMDIEKLSGKTRRSVGIAYLDINGMKQINDEHGHNYGDGIIAKTAEKIKKIFPVTAAYRIGGDEFVIISEGIEEEKFVLRVRELQIQFDGEKDFSVSVGIYWADHNRDIQNTLFLADEQMYLNKKKFYHGKALSGRYRHGLDDVLNMTKPGALGTMIEEGKFPIYYQPKVSPDSQMIIGAEALVRCEMSPEQVVQPGIFIPVLEETRIISTLDFYVFKTVCKQIGKWLNEGKNVVPISVNFSRYTLCEHNFLSKLQTIWEAEQLPKHLLEIEITETVEEDNSTNFFSLIKEIKDLGFSVSIDDFGVKNANLRLFASADFDILKIDKSLIDSLPYNPKTQAILTSISNICRDTGIKMIVEGVETAEQLKLLQQIGCDGIQGFLFSKPLPLKIFENQYVS